MPYGHMYHCVEWLEELHMRPQVASLNPASNHLTCDWIKKIVIFWPIFIIYGQHLQRPLYFELSLQTQFLEVAPIPTYYQKPDLQSWLDNRLYELRWKSRDGWTIMALQILLSVVVFFPFYFIFFRTTIDPCQLVLFLGQCQLKEPMDGQGVNCLFLKLFQGIVKTRHKNKGEPK